MFNKILKTQSSSKARLQNDTLGNDALKALYSAYSSMKIDEFRKYCEKVVQSGGGKQPMKDEIIASMHRPNATQAQILKKAQDFILAGMGLGV